MTAPVTTEALDAAATKALADELFTYANQLVRVETQAGLGGKDLSVRVKEPGWLADLMRRAASALQARRLAAAEAALQQVTAERDEWKSTLRYCERQWQDERGAMLDEIARLRAEGEAKDRTLKAKAEEQVAYWRERQRAEKCLEDGISEDGQTYTPIGDVAAWQGGYCNGRMSEADWWLKTLLHWPSEAARAATAREG